MKDIIRCANRIAAVLPENMIDEWAMILHDTETYKKMTPEDIEEAKQHLSDLVAAKAS